MGKTPGERLREAREAAGLSHEQVAERTKIPSRIVAALERDEYHKVSGPLYVKSFLRAFAQAVNLPPEEIIKVFDQGTGTGVPTPESPEGAVWTEEEVAVRRVGVNYGGLFMRGGVALGALAVLAAVVWFLFLRDGTTETATSAPTSWEEYTGAFADSAAVADEPAPVDSAWSAMVDTAAVPGLERLHSDSLAVDRGRPPGPR